MPGFNQRGPMGDGPMTGRRMGKCTNFGANATNPTDNQTNAANDSTFVRGMGRGWAAGRGMGRGRGMGMGRQHRFRNGQ
ncbi:MAG: DUF5320 domain-containing protein [Paludibacter sp.]